MLSPEFKINYWSNKFHSLWATVGDGRYKALIWFSYQLDFRVGSSLISLINSVTINKIVSVNFKSDLQLKYLVIVFQKGWRSYVCDILTVWQRWVVAAIFLLAHFLFIFLLPVPGCPTGKPTLRHLAAAVARPVKSLIRCHSRRWFSTDVSSIPGRGMALKVRLFCCVKFSLKAQLLVKVLY